MAIQQRQRKKLCGGSLLHGGISGGGDSDPSGATTKYVDGTLSENVTNGSYSIANRDNTGSDGYGYKSLKDAMADAASGETIYIREGTYREVTDTPSSCFHIDKSVVIQPYSGESVELTYDPDNLPGATNNLGPIIHISASDVVIDGTETMTITGTQSLYSDRGGDSDVNIVLNDGLNNVTVRRMTLRQAAHASIKFSGLSDNILIEQIVFDGWGNVGFDHAIYINQGSESGKTTIRFNVFKNSLFGAMHLRDRCRNVDCYANILFGVREGIINKGWDNRYYNNTIWKCPGFVDDTSPWGGLSIWTSESQNLVIRNNVILKSVEGISGRNEDIYLDGASSLDGSNIGNNIYETAGVVTLDPPNFDTWWPDDGTDQQVAVDYDPGFVAADPQTWTDFRLAAGSPLIDAGGPSPFNELLDPTVTDWPTPKTVAGTLPVGAFASE